MNTKIQCRQSKPFTHRTTRTGLSPHLYHVIVYESSSHLRVLEASSRNGRRHQPTRPAAKILVSTSKTFASRALSRSILVPHPTMKHEHLYLHASTHQAPHHHHQPSRTPLLLHMTLTRRWIKSSLYPVLLLKDLDLDLLRALASPSPNHPTLRRTPCLSVALPSHSGLPKSKPQFSTVELTSLHLEHPRRAFLSHHTALTCHSRPLPLSRPAILSPSAIERCETRLKAEGEQQPRRILFRAQKKSSEMHINHCLSLPVFFFFIVS